MASSNSSLARKLEAELASGFVGREEEARVAVLALLTKQHATFIGEPGCVAGDTIVSTEEGKLFYIDDLAGNLLPGVYIADLAIFPPARATELHIYDTWHAIEIITESGRRVRVTPNHPLMTREGWKRADEIKVGDELKVINHLPSPQQYVMIPELLPKKRAYRRLGWTKVKEYKAVKRPTVLDEKLGELLGIFVAEGFFGRQYIGFGVGLEEAELQERIVTLMKDVFSLEPYRKTYRISTKTKTKRACTLRYDTIYVTELFRWLDHDHDKDKRISRWILLSPKSVSASFLRGLFEGDGYVRAKRRYGSISLKSRSRILLEGVQQLLLRHGIRSKIYSFVEKDPRYGKEYKGAVLRINDLDSMIRFRDEIGFISSRKADALRQVIESRKRRSPTKEDYEAVKSVKHINEWVRVYDFHVPETHAFYTNGLLSHNTAKSALIRRLSQLVQCRYFYYLLSKYTVPDEIIGAIDPVAYKAGKFVRNVANKLPTVEVAFIDEIFKGSSETLNCLLNIMNERIFVDSDGTVYNCPLHSLFSASNELPSDSELAAFYDRFLLRHFVRRIDASALEKAIVHNLSLNTNVKPVCSLQEVNQLYNEITNYMNRNASAIAKVTSQLVIVLRQHGIFVSDRTAVSPFHLPRLVSTYSYVYGVDLRKSAIAVSKYVLPSEEALENYKKALDLLIPVELREASEKLEKARDYAVSGDLTNAKRCAAEAIQCAQALFSKPEKVELFKDEVKEIIDSAEKLVSEITKIEESLKKFRRR